MGRKISFAILAFALGLLGVSRVVGLRAKIGAYSAVAWAQDSTPSVDDAAQDDSGGDAIESEPNSMTSPPGVHGAWCGPIDDNQLGAGTISMAIKQKGSKLSGSWTDDLGASGTLKGKVQGDAVIVTLKPRGSKCRFAVNGTLVSPNEVTGNYSIFGCKASDGGTFDITRPTC
jgi:hypothetical protein